MKKSKEQIKEEFISLIGKFKKEEISLDDFSHSSGDLLSTHVKFYGTSGSLVQYLDAASELSYYAREEERLDSFVRFAREVFEFYKLSK